MNNSNFTQHSGSAADLISHGLLANSSDFVAELARFKNDAAFRGSIMFYNDYMNNYTDNFYRHSFKHARQNDYSRKRINSNNHVSSSNGAQYTEEFKTTTTIRALFILKIHSKLLSCLLIAIFSVIVLYRLNRVDKLLQIDFRRFKRDNRLFRKRFMLLDI